jgi:hypothetical protein
MGKYTTYQKKPPVRSNEPHPVWRGIGCVIWLILPVISYGLSAMTVSYAVKKGIQFPSAITGYPVMPGILFRIPGLVVLLNWLQSQYNLYTILLVAFFFVVMLAGAIAIIYALMYRASAPPRYSGVDAPPMNIKVKKYKR